MTRDHITPAGEYEKNIIISHNGHKILIFFLLLGIMRVVYIFDRTLMKKTHGDWQKKGKVTNGTKKMKCMITVERGDVDQKFRIDFCSLGLPSYHYHIRSCITTII